MIMIAIAAFRSYSDYESMFKLNYMLKYVGTRNITYRNNIIL